MAALIASLPELNAVLGETKFLAGYGVEVQGCAPGECDLFVPFAAGLERPGGFVSGMTLMGAADVAMWLAIMTTQGTAETWVTTDMKTAFLRSGVRESIVCRARVLKLGRRIAYGTVETLGASSGLLAHHVISYSRKTHAESVHPQSHGKPQY